MNCMSVGLVRKEESYRVFGGRVAVHCIGMYLYCAYMCHTVHVHVGAPMDTVPLYHCSSLLLIHLPAKLDPLVDFFVAYPKLTSLELREVILPLHSLLTVMRGLHNLRALGLGKVSLSDIRVSD